MTTSDDIPARRFLIPNAEGKIVTMKNKFAFNTGRVVAFDCFNLSKLMRRENLPLAVPGVRLLIQKKTN